jgi:bifunctional non-homologous end joining protein LigD
VATLLTWDELSGGVDPKDFTLRTVPLRLAKQRSDPWKGFFALRQSLPAASRAQSARRQDRKRELRSHSGSG